VKLFEWFIILLALPALFVFLILKAIKDKILPPDDENDALGGGAVEAALLVFGCAFVSLIFWIFVIYEMVLHLRWV
jgi:hypothetical protein